MTNFDTNFKFNIIIATNFLLVTYLLAFSQDVGQLANISKWADIGDINIDI